MTFHSTKFAPSANVSVADAIAQASLAWTADKAQLFLAGGVPVESHVAITRSDTRAQLAVVGADYTVVQQADGFKGIQPLIDAGEARIVSAGYVGNGRKVFIQAELRDGTADVAPGDSVSRYVVFTNSHDGSTAAGYGYSTVRIVCQNTLAMAHRQLGAKFRHTSGVHLALAAAQVEFAAQRKVLAGETDTFKRLLGRKLSDRNLVRYVRETLAEGAGNDETIVVRNVERIVELAHTGEGARPGTLWGGFNAITNYATHERGRSADARANANMFGAGPQLMTRALDVAVAYAEKLPAADYGYYAAQSTATATAEFGQLLGKPSAVI